MSAKAPGTLSLVLVPALLTLVISVVRLCGEIFGWHGLLFGTPEAGGGQGLLGISWLIFVFGLWFGLRLQRAGRGPASRGKALVLSLVAVGVLAGGMPALQAAGVMWFPDAEHPGEARGLGWMLGLMGVACVVSFVAWGRAGRTLLVYGLLARLPVVAITWIALRQPDWNTHYTKIPAFFTNVAEADRAGFLMMPQLTFWPGLTVLLGTAMACLGSYLGGRKAQG